MYSNSLLPSITKPTRITRTTATLIDNIFSTSSAGTLGDRSGILVTDISDHYPVFHINHTTNTVSSVPVVRRDMSQRNINKFSDGIRQTDWTTVLNSDSPSESFAQLHHTITTHYRNSFPLLKSKTKYEMKIPWLTSALKNSIARKNWLYKLSKNKASFSNEYTTYKNKLTNVFARRRRNIMKTLSLKIEAI